MPSTPPYAPTYDFAALPYNGPSLMAQLQAISAYTNDLASALGQTIRDDDQLADACVRQRNLHPDLSEWLQSRIDGTVATEALDYWFPVDAASTGNVANLYDNQTIDGYSVTSGMFVLLKDQTDPTQNGLWEVHNTGDPAPHADGLWVRRDDLAEGSSSGKGWAVIVREGTANSGTAWGIVAGGVPGEQPVVGTDPLEFFSVFAPFPLPVSRGGTGSSTAAGARLNLAAPGKAVHEFTGDGSTTTFSFAHGLGSDDVIVACKAANGEFELPILYATAGQASAGFVTAPPAGYVFSLIVIG